MLEGPVSPPVTHTVGEYEGSFADADTLLNRTG